MTKKKVEEAMPQEMQEVIRHALPKLEETLKKLPAEKVAQAKKEVEKLFSGDLSWADLSKYTPEKLQAITEMGYNQFRLGQYDSAERIFKGLTVIDPDHFYYHQMLGATFQRKGNYPAAILEYSVAVDLNASDIVSLTNRGESYFKLGIFPLANADFDKAIGLDSKDEDRWAKRAKMLREQIRLMKKEKK